MKRPLAKVRFDSMQINFYVLARPGDLDELPTSYIGSFYAPGASQPLLTELVRTFPTLTLVDMDEIIKAVQSKVRRVSQAVRVVFALSALAGAIAVYAALAASDEECTRETVIVRALGGTRRELMRSQLLKFTLIGVLAALSAWVLAWGLSEYVLELPYRLAWCLLPLGVAGASAPTLGVALRRLRGIVSAPPWMPLRATS